MDTENKIKVLKILSHLPESIDYLGQPDLEYLKRKFAIESEFDESYLRTVLKIIKETPSKEFSEERRDGVFPIGKQ